MILLSNSSSFTRTSLTAPLSIFSSSSVSLSCLHFTKPLRSIICATGRQVFVALVVFVVLLINGFGLD